MTTPPLIVASPLPDALMLQVAGPDAVKVTVASGFLHWLITALVELGVMVRLQLVFSWEDEGFPDPCWAWETQVRLSVNRTQPTKAETIAE